MNGYYRPEGFSEAPQTAMEKQRERAQTPAKLLLSAAVFGAAFSYLFTKQGLGVNGFIFVMLLYGFALYNSKLFMKRTFGEEKLITFFSLPVIFLAAYMFIGSTFLNPLSLLVILFVMFVQYIVLSGNAVYRWYQPLFILDLLFAGINRMLLGIGQFISGSVNSIFSKQSDNKKGVVFGLLIGAVLLILIVPLLLLADPNISKTIRELFSKIYLGDVFLYIFLFLLAASAAVAPIATAKRSEYTGRREAQDYTEKRPIQDVTSSVALTMLSIVYVLFGAVQFTYFFKMPETMANTLGLTSSAYAVRGFGELLFVTCLNFIIIAAALRFTKQKDGKAQICLKILCCILVAFNFVIMASSHMRLQYYENSFGYTLARFVSHSFMILLVIFNVIMLARIFFSDVKLIKFYAAAALLFYCVIIAVNPEFYVARSNIQRYEQTGKIDVAYMFTLSGDAISETCDFVIKHPEYYDDAARQAMQSKYAEYAKESNYGWQSQNLAIRNAYYKMQKLS